MKAMISLMPRERLQQNFSSEQAFGSFLQHRFASSVERRQLNHE
jgi:hypothetical protein